MKNGLRNISGKIRNQATAFLNKEQLDNTFATQEDYWNLFKNLIELLAKGNQMAHSKSFKKKQGVC